MTYDPTKEYQPQRDENLECAYSMLTEAEAENAKLQAENANLLLRIEAENEADNEMHAINKARIEALEGQVQVADMLANKLKAENAKLREAARHALELAKIIERGDRVEGKNHASSEIVNTLRAALGSDGPEDAS